MEISNDRRWEILEESYGHYIESLKGEHLIIALLIKTCKDQEDRIQMLEKMHPTDQYLIRQLKSYGTGEKE